MTGTRPATVRFYFDADVLGVAKVIAGIRPDVTYPGDPGAEINKRSRPPCPIASPAVKDRIWIPEVAGLGWLIITRDRHIQRYPAEIAAVRDHGAKMIALSTAEAVNVWSQLELVMLNWRRLESVVDEPGPFIKRAGRSGLVDVKLD